MTSAEATTSTDRTGTGKADAAPAHNLEAERLHALLEPEVQANRLYLEDVSIQIAGANRVVHVVVDLPQDETGGVGLDVIAEISKTLSDILDNDPSTDARPYELEVSSPGVGRPLTEERHWHRARGRMVKVNVVQGDNVTGRVQSVDDGESPWFGNRSQEGHEAQAGRARQDSFRQDPERKSRDRSSSRLDEAGLENEHNGPSEEA